VAGAGVFLSGSVGSDGAPPDLAIQAAAAIHGVSAARPGDLFALPRLPVHPRDGRFELLLKASGAYRWWSRMPRLGLLRALRRGGPGAPPAASSKSSGSPRGAGR